MATSYIKLMGGFGNQLFMIAFIYSYSKKYNLNFCVSNVEIHHKDSTSSHIVERLKKLENYKDINFVEDVIIEKEYFYQEFPKITRNTFFRSYFQNVKYFEDYRDDLLLLFSEPSFIKKEILDYMFIHVRLGDYLASNHQHYNLDLNKYLTSCLEENEKYILFTDSPHLVYKIYPFLKRENIILNEETDPLVCFYKMKNCYRGGICSNSSFSWMASWLNENKNKKVFLPKTWIKNTNYDMSYPEATMVDI